MLSLEGTATNPDVGVTARFRDLRPERSEAPPLAGDLEARLGPERGKVRFGVDVKGRRVANLNAEWEGDARKLASADPATEPHSRARRSARVHRVPDRRAPGRRRSSAPRAASPVASRSMITAQTRSSRATLAVAPLAARRSALRTGGHRRRGPLEARSARARSLRQRRVRCPARLKAAMDSGARVFPGKVRALLQASLDARRISLGGSPRSRSGDRERARRPARRAHVGRVRRRPGQGRRLGHAAQRRVPATDDRPALSSHRRRREARAGPRASHAARGARVLGAQRDRSRRLRGPRPAERRGQRAHRLRSQDPDHLRRGRLRRHVRPGRRELSRRRRQRAVAPACQGLGRGRGAPGGRPPTAFRSSAPPNT